MFLAVFIPMLWGALATAMASLVWRAVIALGIGFVTYTGSMVLVNAMESAVTSSFSGMGATAVNFLAFMWVDKAITVIFSAVVTSLAVRGISGSIKRAVLK